MIYRLLADSVLILHFLFIGFVVFGGVFALRSPRLAWIHVPAACWGAFIELSGGLCPLTVLEVEFRRMAGEAGYSGSFIEHYLLPVIYPVGLTRDMQFGLAGLLILVNIAIYARLVSR